MSKIKIKQINSDGQAEGAVLMTDGEGNNYWGIPTSADGGNVLLGAAEDGSYTDPRYTGGKSPAVGLAPSTKVSTAIDSLNEVLGLLLPTAPAPLSTGVLSLNTGNTTARAANGYTSNSLTGAPTAGSIVSRVTATSVSTNVLEDLGSGNSGSVSLFLNNSAASGETLAFTDNTGDFKATGVLRITDNKWGGTAVGGGAAPDGFFQTFDSQVVGAAASVGFNTIQIKHTDSGDTSVLSYVRDTLTANPAVSGITLTAPNNPSVVYFSGVAHLVAGNAIPVSANATNLAGETYASGTILSLSGPGTTVNFAAGQGGLPTILTKDTLSFDMVSQNFNTGGSVFDRAAKITVSATNPNGSGNAVGSTNLIVFTGGAGVRETAVTGPATTTRVAYSLTGDTPTGTTTSAWNSNTDLSVANFVHEAAIVGGVIRNDVTNYSTGYIPAGPNYSTKAATQYITFSVKTAGKSSISITTTGTFAGVWVALPGVSDDASKSPAALGGTWWDGFALYSGAGVPGRANDTTAGCANGTLPNGSGTQTFVLTFGTESSSNATNNEILVRFKLTTGQAISAISFA